MNDALRRAARGPVYWFVRLQQAIAAGDIKAATRATQQLRRLQEWTSSTAGRACPNLLLLASMKPATSGGRTMPRKPPSDSPPARLPRPPALQTVHVIAPDGVYGVEEAQAALRLRRSTIRREVREGRLRVSKRAGRYFLLGKWLIEWIEGGELHRRRAAANGDGAP